MTVAFYADVNFPGPVIKGLRRRGVDVRSARTDRMQEAADEEILAHATSLSRVVLTLDQDYFEISLRWQAEGRDFAGVLFAREKKLTVRELIDELEILAKAGDLEDFFNQLDVLPVRLS